MPSLLETFWKSNALYWHAGGACELQPVLIAFYCASLSTISASIRLVSESFYSLSGCLSSKSCSFCPFSTWNALDLIFFTNHFKFRTLPSELMSWNILRSSISILILCPNWKTKQINKELTLLPKIFFSCLSLELKITSSRSLFYNGISNHWLCLDALFYCHFNNNNPYYLS